MAERLTRELVAEKAIVHQESALLPPVTVDRNFGLPTALYGATVALLLYFTGFSIFLLGAALFMQNVWHFSALRAGIGIAPAPIASVGFALNAGPIQARPAQFTGLCPMEYGKLICIDGSTEI